MSLSGDIYLSKAATHWHRLSIVVNVSVCVCVCSPAQACAVEPKGMHYFGVYGLFISKTQAYLPYMPAVSVTWVLLKH